MVWKGGGKPPLPAFNLIKTPRLDKAGARAYTEGKKSELNGRSFPKESF